MRARVPLDMSAITHIVMKLSWPSVDQLTSLTGSLTSVSSRKLTKTLLELKFIAASVMLMMQCLAK